MQVVTNAAEWVAGLDDPARCTTLEPADDVRPLPPPALAEEVESLRDRLWRAKTEMRRGDLDDALATASAVLPEANGLGFASLVAESHFELGRVHRARREWDEAQSFLGAAYFEARAARNAEVEFDAAAEMIHLLAVNLWRPDEARDWLARARAADDGQSLEATVALLVLEGMILTGLEDYPGAVRVTLEAHARARELGDRHPIYVSAASALLVALNNVDRYEEAVVLARESIEVRTRMLGAEHPSLAPVLHNLGIAAWELGRADEGRAALERSVALERLHRGPRSYDVAIGLLHIGRRSMFDRDLARARATLDEACPIFEESVGVDHAASMSCTLTLGDVALAAGRAVEASAIFDRVRVLAESEIGADSGLVGLALSGKGRAELAMQRLPQARATLERAWEILARNEPQQRSIEFAEVCLALADATWRSGGSHDRALELAHAAASPLDMPRNPVLVAHDRLVDAWLRAHEGQGARE
jgi:tetratricopeptide (TPR) repeat protein